MQTLLIDNYDSFSHILFQYLWELNGTRPIFIHNDAWTIAQVKAAEFDNIVISPGPGHPAWSRDFGICPEILATFPDTPILGVCLGHQGMGLHLGARVVAAPQVRHGKASRIRHEGKGIFAGLPTPLSVMRYHSLVLESSSIPHVLRVTARSEDDDQIMAVEVPGRPWYGVQFHPESIGSDCGKTLLANFRDLTASRRTFFPGAREIRGGRTDDFGEVNTLDKTGSSGPRPIRLPWRDPESVFATLFAAETAAFWLDAAAATIAGTPMGSQDESPRVSYMGTGRRLFATRGSELSVLEPDDGQGAFGVVGRETGDPLDWLERNLKHTVTCEVPQEDGFRCAFRGGLIGYLGYELKRFTGTGDTPSSSHGSIPDLPLSEWPDALFLEPNRLLAFDHESREVWAWVSQDPAAALRSPAVDGWLSELQARWETLPESELNLRRTGDEAVPEPDGKADWKLSLSKPEYLARIRNLQANIHAGESYEACLTNSLECAVEADPFLVYRILRRTNPAPYAAYVKFPHGAILSASPECFLKSDAAGNLISRPIKGTRPRGRDAKTDAALRADLAGNPKDISENLMIVDLVRNDFGRVCAVGSVDVPERMRVEAHPTVFQLVSTVCGRLAEGQSPLSAVRACFPGGSMTGAPKLRTMELLETAEGRARGIFSGALGYLGADGAMDLGMVIRTLVYSNGRFSVGCGGAILAESDPEEEFTEAMLKAWAPMRAVELAVSGNGPGWRLEFPGIGAKGPE